MPLVVTVALAASPTGPASTEPTAELAAAAATLPGPGPLPALVPPALLKAHQGALTLDDAIDQCVTQSMAAAGTPGAAVAVALDGALILERGYGVTRRQAGAPVDADTFNLAGLVVERASGLPYRRYIAEHVLAPAGMTRTTFDPAAVIADGNYSYGHVTSPGGLETVYASGWTAAFTLEHAGYGIFLADLDEDGELDSDFEFLDRGVPERVNWLRNRSVVGVRRTTPRPAGGSLVP